jgi:alpha-tubulin suppressor-like RCC1 family protein
MGATAAVAAPTPSVGPIAGGTVVDVDAAAVKFVDVDFMYGGALGLDSNGELYTWGSAFGVGGTNPVPLRVAMPSTVKVVSFAAGGGFAIAATTNGLVYTWGSNFDGALGDGTTTDNPTPTLVNLPAGVQITKVAAGADFALALASDGTVYVWGTNSFGQLGIGTTVNSFTPVQVNSLTDISSIHAGATFAYAIDGDGVLHAWGRNDGNQLGDGTTVQRRTAVTISLPADVTTVSAFDSYSLARLANGDVYGWGYNGSGELGTGNTNNSAVPVKALMPSGVSIVDVGAGSSSGYAVADNGDLYSWGYNTNGALGNGTNVNSETPALASTPSGVRFVSVDGGSSNGMAVTESGAIYAWGGSNGNGVFGNGGTVTSRVPVLGPNFKPSSVLFDTSTGTSFSATGDVATVTSPAHAAGLVDVTVTSTLYGGTTVTPTTADLTFVDGFRYIAPPVITTTTLPNGTVSTSYSSEIEVTSTEETSVEVTAGTLPPGLTFNPQTWSLTGTPTTAGTYTFTVTADNGYGTDTQQYSIVIDAAAVNAVPPIITTLTVPGGVVGDDYSTTIEATGDGPIVFALVSGTLPPGLTLDPATGIISGTPTTSGTYSFTISATNAAGVDEQEYTLEVVAAADVEETSDDDEASGGARLAFTGLDSEGLLLASGILLLFGGALAVVAVQVRRRRA